MLVITTLRRMQKTQNVVMMRRNRSVCRMVLVASGNVSDSKEGKLWLISMGSVLVWVDSASAGSAAVIMVSRIASLRRKMK